MDDEGGEMGVGVCSTVVGAAVTTLSTTRVTSTTSRITSAVGLGAHPARTKAATINNNATEVAILLVCRMFLSPSEKVIEGNIVKAEHTIPHFGSFGNNKRPSCLS